jgi:hypothetical protein
MEACSLRLLLDSAIGAAELQQGVDFDHDLDEIRTR